MNQVKEEAKEDCASLRNTVVVKLELPWSMEEEMQDQPSDVYSTVQPMSGNTSQLLQSLNRCYVCPHCSASFALVSSLGQHMVSSHGEPLSVTLSAESPVSSMLHDVDSENTDRMNPTPQRLSTEMMDCIRKDSEDSSVDFVIKLEQPWSTKEEPQEESSAVCCTVQSMSNCTAGSLLSRNSQLVCLHCSASFVLPSSLELHMASTHGERLYAALPASFTPEGCDVGDCSSLSRDKVDILDGIKSLERMEDKMDNREVEKKEEKLKKRQPMCDTCGKVFTRAGQLKIHSLIHAGIRPFVCDVCNKTFTQASAMKRHKLIHAGVKPFVCDVCYKAFAGSDRLRTHQLTHTSRLKSFLCDLCDKAFTNAGNLNRHKLTHTSPKSFVCDVCKKGFTLYEHLKRHKIIHTGERPFKCPHCDGDFNQSSSLRMHIRSVHACYKPYVCEVCDAAFSKAGSLKRHQRIHTGEKPYSCDMCGAAFSVRSYLTVHKRTHTGEKPYACTDCGKSFACSGTLKNHRLTHTGEKPHACPHCPSAFAWSCDLKKHILRLHQ